MPRSSIYKVLLLEDCEDYYWLFVHSLNRQAPNQHEVDRAETLAEALRLLELKTYDVIVSDLSVPDSQGMETISRFREFDRDTPIIALTGCQDKTLEDEVLAHGGQDYLIKGNVAGRDISRSIHHAIERQQAFNKIRKLADDLADSHRLLEQQALTLKKKNHRLRRLNKMAQEFVDNVSHDFRTPLTVIKDYVSLIREGIVGDVNTEQEAMLDKVAVRTDDLNNMVDDLLDVSKLDSGTLNCWRRRVDPTPLVTRAMALVAKRSSIKEINLTVDMPEELPAVYCDSEKADRVITNLVVNAVKFTANGGKVRLWAADDPVSKQVTIGVTDNGPGIEPSELSRLFERFTQDSHSMKPNQKGFGLGLNIAHKLSQLNLGNLNANSQVGIGSTFSFSLPYDEPLEIFKRWVEKRKDPLAATFVVKIELDEACEEFDHFLNAQLRRYDLLFQIDTKEWLIVLLVNKNEFDRWEDRLADEYASANRNRPAGNFPNYRLNVVSEYDEQHSVQERLKDFEAIQLAAPTVSV